MPTDYNIRYIINWSINKEEGFSLIDWVMTKTMFLRHPFGLKLDSVAGTHARRWPFKLDSGSKLE